MPVNMNTSVYTCEERRRRSADLGAPHDLLKVEREADDVSAKKISHDSDMWGRQVSDISTSAETSSESASENSDSPRLTLQEALALQSDLLAGFEAAEFQRDLLRLLWDYGGPDASKHLTGRRELAFTVQKEVLPKYGFEASSAGVKDMMSTTEAMLPTSEKLMEGAEAIHDALGLLPPMMICRDFEVPWSAPHA
eukprot:gnl/TRDRNA2_/TRDRNA2_201116_c0_seq1.p1 gnl/TRDRNA2_/TRDRNA2_201116_c0~~gnl/TRDRNA2_/TRDRNA2_201116_c0_seq1.p1  ORF type:complete len:227 (+),score=41.56 gnl/TRDRNA2_/TRDRNA2_201116_c0_seq1:98-682(+)